MSRIACIARVRAALVSRAAPRHRVDRRFASSRRFDPPPNSPSAFLAELKSFTAAARPGQDLASQLPLAFSGDASLILGGKRRVVTRDSAFDFTCTACGHCCKSYPNDVMLDPHDVWLVSRAPTVDQQQGSTTSLHASYPRAFRAQLGLFESNRHLAVASPNGASTSSQSKLAPVLFLRTKKVKQVSKTTGEAQVAERCWFAVPARKDEVDMAADAHETASLRDQQPQTVRPPTRTPPAAGAAGLKCRLGPAHMPTSCALYPLGELYSTKDQPSSRYYTLDTTNCEGTHVASTPKTRTTVGQYAERNRLDERRAEWESFEAVAQGFAAHGWLGFASPLPQAFRDELRLAVATVWYDFDSLDSAPVVGEKDAARRFPDWPSAHAAIVRATRAIQHATESYVRDAPSGELRAREAWRGHLRREGALRRDEVPSEG